ncbi:MAG TPA: class I SAM-dependent methyltransferase [Kofleriaceae bacterium]|nr:class I SAM-dependent methyltransferase [Kofleriaceae bacterium]
MSTDAASYGHFGIQVAEYDEAIVRYIPYYRELIDGIATWLVGHVPAGGVVVDLGAGTGALSAAVLSALPDARVEMVDLDGGMLEAGAARLQGLGAGDRARGRQADFFAAFETVPACAAVVASLALHHVADPERKGELYRRIRGALQPGGVLLVGDCVLHDGGAGERRIRTEWAAHMQRHGLTAAEAQVAFEKWNAEDHYLPLTEELRLLAGAGFARPDVFWRRGPCAIYGGFAE